MTPKVCHVVYSFQKSHQRLKSKKIKYMQTRMTSLEWELLTPRSVRQTTKSAWGPKLRSYEPHANHTFLCLFRTNYSVRYSLVKSPLLSNKHTAYNMTVFFLSSLFAALTVSLHTVYIGQPRGTRTGGSGLWRDCTLAEAGSLRRLWAQSIMW